MLARSLKMAFWVTYDHLGKLIVASLIWVMPVALAGFLGWAALSTGDTATQVVAGIPALVLGFGVFLPVLSAGLAHMIKELIDTRDGSLGAFFVGIRLYWRRAAALGCVYAAVSACLVTSAWFYATKLRGTAPWLGYGIAGLAVWCLLFTLLTALLVIPALVQKKGSAAETLKLTALLVLDNPFFTMGLALQVIAVTAMAMVVAPVFFFLYGAVVLAMVSSAYEMLARKYAALETGAQGPLARKGGAAMTDDDADAKDDYLNRGVRDFLFPWKG